MTQDTGFFDNSYNRAALHILAGAAAGIGSRDGGEALYRGVQVGTALQNSYLKDKQFQHRQQKDEEYNRLRSEGMELDNKYKQKRLEAMESDQDDDDFLSELKVMQSFSQGRRMGYRKDLIGQATSRKPTDGTLTYPIDENMAEMMLGITKADETLADFDVMFHAIHESENGNSKKAKQIANILGLKHNLQVVTGESGKKFVRYDGKAFPLEYESAGKIKALVEQKAFALQSKMTDIMQMRNKGESGAQMHMLQKLDGLALSPEQKIAIADNYRKQIKGNDLQLRVLDFAHSANRIINAKDPEFTQFEMAEMANVLKKSNIEFHQANDGSYYIDGKSFNDYVNRFNPGQKVEVMTPSKQKVDKNLLSDMFARSGLDNLSNEFKEKATKLSEQRQQAYAQEMKQKDMLDLQSKMNTQKASVFGEDLKAQASEKRIQNDIKRNRLAKYSYEEIVDNTPELRDNPEVLDMLETEASEWIYRTKKNSTAFKKLDDQFRNQFGTSLKKSLEGSEDGEEGSMKKFAIGWLRDNTDTSKVVSPKMLDTFKKNLVRKFLRNPEAYMKSRDQVSSFNKAQHKANDQIRKFNKKAEAQSNEQLNKILSLGEQ